MIIYLAARYSRRLELCGYRAQLAARGIGVTSRWLDGGHQIGTDGQPLTEEGERRFEAGDASADELRVKFANDDLEDVLAARLLVAFTETPRTATSRGGRHVELGIALGASIPIAVVGPRENIFCWLPQIRHFSSWAAFLASCDLWQPPAGPGPHIIREGRLASWGPDLNSPFQPESS